jgi:outer membrane protein OmpA-like peptidoglycan-associated protein
MRLPRTIALLLLSAFASAAFGAEGDVAGAKDPPGIGQRFPGARIVYYAQEAFDAYVLPTGKATARGRLATSRNLEGRVTDVRYEIPAERTTLEVMRNYEDALEAKGFDTLYACSDADCGGRDFNHIAGAGYRGFQETPKGQRYLAARKGDTWASVFVVKNYGVGGPTKDRVYVRTVTVETRPMETKLVTVDAAAMEKAIDATGHVAVYGIQFDSDSDVPLPASREAIAEVAKMLKANPKLKLHVVGHTDGQGSHEHNLALSKRRAQAVVKALTGAHGIDAGRLLASGVASLAPVASNADEAGRAKNRRVEIVAR